MIQSALHDEIDNVACCPYKLTETQMPSSEPFASENENELLSCYSNAINSMTVSYSMNSALTTYRLNQSALAT